MAPTIQDGQKNRDQDRRYESFRVRCKVTLIGLVQFFPHENGSYMNAYAFVHVFF